MSLNNVEVWLSILLLYILVPFICVVIMCACYTVPWIERLRRVTALHTQTEYVLAENL